MEELRKVDTCEQGAEAIRIEVPPLRPAALGLGLCNVRIVLNTEQLVALDRDLTQIARHKHQAPPNDVIVS